MAVNFRPFHLWDSGDSGVLDLDLDLGTPSWLPRFPSGWPPTQILIFWFTRSSLLPSSILPISSTGCRWHQPRQPLVESQGSVQYPPLYGAGGCYVRRVPKESNKTGRITREKKKKKDGNTKKLWPGLQRYLRRKWREHEIDGRPPGPQALGDTVSQILGYSS